jgi:hypothetical protein
MTCALGRLFAMRSSKIQKLKLKDDIIFRMTNLFITLLRRVLFEVVIQDLAGNQLKECRVRTVIEQMDLRLGTTNEDLSTF